MYKGVLNLGAWSLPLVADLAVLSWKLLIRAGGSQQGLEHEFCDACDDLWTEMPLFPAGMR